MVQEVYKNGLPFSDSLAKNLIKLKERIDNKKSALIIIEGGLGEGKTTLGVHVLDYFNSLYGLPLIDLKGHQLSMGGVKFLEGLRINYETKLPCIGYDEAGDFSRRGSLTGFNAMLNRTFETFRAFKCLVVVIIPSFDVLDNQLINNKIPRLLLTLKRRTKTYGNYYGYSLYRINLLKYRMSKTTIKQNAYNTVKPNIWGHFKDLDPERSAILDDVSTKNKIDILKKSEVRIEGLLTYPELASKLFKSIIWVRIAVSKLKLKHSKEIKRIKYFDRDVLARLSSYSDERSESQRGRKRKE